MDDLDVTNKVSIFNHLTADEVFDGVEDNKFAKILGDSYEKFIEFCASIKDKKDEIKSISCYIENDVVIFVIDK